MNSNPKEARIDLSPLVCRVRQFAVDFRPFSHGRRTGTNGELTFSELCKLLITMSSPVRRGLLASSANWRTKQFAVVPTPIRGGDGELAPGRRKRDAIR
jgi:hypothetical protein